MNQTPLRVAVIGSGPSGLYAAEALIKQSQIPVSVDVIERLPTPFGLVRYGVAPDHHKIKSVSNLMQKTLDDPRVRFLGNVEFGSDLSHADLKQHYHAIIYAVGASSDRNLGIPGESLAGSLSATEFVAWYNGHPDAEHATMDLSNIKAVAVIGVGNVAVDVTRILAKTVDELKVTDIADHTLPVLQDSAVTDVYMLGRRGAAQAKFTTKELRELGELLIADVVVKPEEVTLDPVSEAAIQGQPAIQKNVEVLHEFAAKPLEGKPRRVHLRFLVSPIEILGSDRVEGLKIERNCLDENQNAVGTGQFETLPVQMVLRSVGYKGVPQAGVPFDARKGIIPNVEGRVVSDGQVVTGEYVAGWIKRGPSGVIGTNKADSVDTIKQLLADVPNLPDVQAPEPEALTRLLKERGVRVVTVNDWLALDHYETEAGKAQGRPRVKVVSKEKMLGLIPT